MGSEYKASEKGKETAGIDDVDLYNQPDGDKEMGKREREREIGRAVGRGMWDVSVECRRREGE